MNFSVFLIIFVIGITLLLPQVQAQPTVSIIMEKTTYSYCEKLFYTIEVSEITGDPAIIHIRDETGKGSSAIPIPISNLQNPIPSLVPFEKEVFPLGKYFIDVEYSGANAIVEFNLVDSNRVCIPELIKPIMANWLSGNISDGFMIDAIEKYIDKQIINIPFEINEDNVYGINVPEWVKNVGNWWMKEIISDEDFAQVINYLIEKNFITHTTNLENEI